MNLWQLQLVSIDIMQPKAMIVDIGGGTTGCSKQVELFATNQ
jgi:Ethanolamine utilization protein EutJ (predicted chaperonin)